MTDACRHCGEPLPAKRKLNQFCSYAHRAAWLPPYQTGLIGSKNTKQNKALRTLKRGSVGHFAFTRVNSVTQRISRGGKVVGWLMETAWVGGARARWVACVGDARSESLPLKEAKLVAGEMLRDKNKGTSRTSNAHIDHLNKIAAREGHLAEISRDRRQWPIDLMGGQRSGRVDPKIAMAVLEAEAIRPSVDEGASRPTLNGDDYQLDYDEGGYPELPACLDRHAS